MPFSKCPNRKHLKRYDTLLRCSSAFRAVHICVSTRGERVSDEFGSRDDGRSARASECWRRRRAKPGRQPHALAFGQTSYIGTRVKLRDVHLCDARGPVLMGLWEGFDWKVMLRYFA